MSIPHAGIKSRWSLILCALAVFLWSAPEDSQALSAALLGGVCAVVLVAQGGMRLFGGLTLPPRLLLILWTLAGALTGLSAALLAALLMLFKNIRHAHVFPDYPPEMMLAMLTRAPVWTLAGLCAGVGVAMLWLAVQTKSTQRL